MMLVAMVVTILMGMIHLFQVTWATQNSHIRAREALLHGDHYLQDYAPRDARIQVARTPFEVSSDGAANYDKASVPDSSGEPQGASASYEFSATASDSTRDDSFGSQTVDVTAAIVSPPQ